MRTYIKQNYEPKVGDFCNAIIADPTRKVAFIFDSDGLWSRFEPESIRWGKIIGDIANQEDLQEVFGEIRDEIIAKAGELNIRIDGVVTDVDNLRMSLENEAIIRKGYDDDLAAQDVVLQNNIDQEEAARIAGDNNLQGQIDAIVASSDVKDIVGTHAELEEYDVTTLGENDIIKVLQDETRDNATTYYRWISPAFEFIGSEGPFYTKSETDTLLEGKADVDDIPTLYTTVGQNTDGAMTQKAISEMHTKFDANGNRLGYFFNATTPNYVFVSGGGTAYGDGATAANGGVAYGGGANANGSGSLALGPGSTASGDYTLAIGGGAKAETRNNIGSAFAFGPSSTASGETTFAAGASASASSYAVAMGTFANATSNGAIAIGSTSSSTGRTTASKDRAVAIGAGAVSDQVGAVAVGASASVTEGGTEAFGMNSIAKSSGRAYAGGNATAGSLAFGGSASNGSYTLGGGTATNGSIAILGTAGSTTGGGNSIAIGLSANAAVSAGLAVGNSSSVVYDSAAFGNSAKTTATETVALGGSAKANHQRSVALGKNSETSRTYEVSIGTSTMTRYIANVKAGELDTDAVNVKQLNDVVGDIETILESI